MLISNLASTIESSPIRAAGIVPLLRLEALPAVKLPADPDVLPVTLPVTLPSKLATRVPAVIVKFPVSS